MKNNLSPSIPTLSNGVTVAFEDITYSCDMSFAVEVHGFVVVLGNVLRIGSGALYEATEPIWREVQALAVESAEEMVDRRRTNQRELRAWYARQ